MPAIRRFLLGIEFARFQLPQEAEDALPAGSQGAIGRLTLDETVARELIDPSSPLSPLGKYFLAGPLDECPLGIGELIDNLPIRPQFGQNRQQMLAGNFVFDEQEVPQAGRCKALRLLTADEQRHLARGRLFVAHFHGRSARRLAAGDDQPLAGIDGERELALRAAAARTAL